MTARVLALSADGRPLPYEARISSEEKPRLSSTRLLLGAPPCRALRTPVHGTFHGYDVYSSPPPSSGGIALVEMLNMTEPFDLRNS